MKPVAKRPASGKKRPPPSQARRDETRRHEAPPKGLSALPPNPTGGEARATKPAATKPAAPKPAAIEARRHEARRHEARRHEARRHEPPPTSDPAARARRDDVRCGAEPRHALVGRRWPALDPPEAGRIIPRRQGPSAVWPCPRADVVQLVEQRFCKPPVPGSSPVVGSKCRSTAMGSPRGRSLDPSPVPVGRLSRW